MKRFLVVLAALVCLALSGCSDRRAEQIFETAQFEELQKNHPHALKLYREIISKYPNSEYAKRAEQRISALQEEK
jgi:outer membrane protein assembly factor BamD (BamD/ComL family)